MQDGSARVARVISIVATVLIALACGTNYAYSTWAPQFAQRLQLSSTESNLIGSFGNLGMYIPAILVGVVVDSKGPKLGVGIGGVLLGIGYFAIYIAFKSGEGSFAVPTLCFFSFLTGCGSCAAFLTALKTAAVNYPDSRGTATGFPLAGYGLSAFMFSTISTFAFPDDISMFLLTLAAVTFTLNTISFFFVRLLPPSHPNSDVHSPDHFDSQVLHGAKSQDCPTSPKDNGEELVAGVSREVASSTREYDGTVEDANWDTRETVSLLSKSSGSSPEEYGLGRRGSHDARSDEADVRGLKLLAKSQFWQLFLLFGLLSGIGLMNINNIGNDVQALWRHYDDSASQAFIAKEQSVHVSILSLASCAGRLLSGAGSDMLAKKLNMSRMWCFFVSASAFTAAQSSSLQIQNPHYLAFVSGLTGLGYGILYGFVPSLLAQKFGVMGMSQNWGTIILAPVVSGNLFNILYGEVYDKHSIILPDGERECREGLSCYRIAAYVALFTALVAAAFSLWCIWRENRDCKEEQRVKRTNHDRDA